MKGAGTVRGPRRAVGGAAGRFLAAVAGLALALAAQDPPDAPDAADRAEPGAGHAGQTDASQTDASKPAPTVCEGWLQEILDLDPAAAMATYGRVAADPAASLLDRQIAVARLMELRRIGVGSNAPPPDLSVLPAALQQHVLQVPQTQPVLDQELAAGRGTAEDARAFFAANQPPQLRPFVIAVLAAADPANRSGRRSYRPSSIHNPTLVEERFNAAAILRLELDGKLAAAAELRQRTFPDWRPRRWPADAAAAWDHVRRNLEEWRAEPLLTPQDQEDLVRLAAALGQAAATAPQRALEMIDRLPLYAERLRAGERR